MADTFSQIYIQIVFSVQNRENLIRLHWEDKIYRYITGIITNKGQKLIAINGMPDHIHILIGMKPNCRLSDLVREIKKSSNQYINENNFVNGRFKWQKGYGAFSYSHSALSNVINYIKRQKDHHKVRSFKEEYILFLKKYEIEHNQDYLFDWIEK